MFIRNKNQSKFITNLLAYGASEAASKLSRLFVVVVVARSLGVEQIGLAASALAVCEIIKCLTENGIGQRIIAAQDQHVDGLCRTAHRAFWAWCIALFLLQLSVAGALFVADQAIIAGLIAVAALEYLFMPAGLVQAALAMREGKLKQTAGIAGVQIVGANALSVALAVFFPSPLVLILPRVLTAPYWLIAMRRLRPWTPNQSASKAPMRPFIEFGLPVVGIELVKALRLHADKLVIGLLLGPEGLGIYFMAFNAGLSLSTSFIAAFEKVVFPQIARAQSGDQATSDTLVIGLMLISPVIIAQSYFAGDYVPVLLGDGWNEVAPVVSILCLTAIPLTVWSVAAAKLRLNGRPDVEFAVTLTATAALTLSAIVTAPYGLTTMAIAYLVSLTVVLGGAAVPTLMPTLFPQTKEV